MTVRIRDISPRLAFQAHPGTTSQKIELIDRLIAAGVTAVEVSSFVNPKMVPGMADAEQVFAGVKRAPGVSLECCVANATGLKRAIDAGADAAWFLLAVDDEFSRLNTGRSIADSLGELERMQAIADGSAIKLGTYLIAAFGGPVGLARGPEDVRPLAERLVEMDVKDWILADSCGYAAPPQIRDMVAFASTLTEPSRLNVQIHDSRGMGLANVAALAEMGFHNIDTALAGSGGHPAAPDALVGGVCTEDAVQMLDLMGFQTGVDLQALVETANWLGDILGGRKLGFVRQTGPVPLSEEQSARLRSIHTSTGWRTDATAPVQNAGHHS